MPHCVNTKEAVAVADGAEDTVRVAFRFERGTGAVAVPQGANGCSVKVAVMVVETLNLKTSNSSGCLQKQQQETQEENHKD